MGSVTVDPADRIAVFRLRPAKPVPHGGPPVDLVLAAPGYHAALSVPGGYPGGDVALPIAPPRHAEIGTACFLNRGTTTVLLDGTTEARTVSRSEMQIDGRSVLGDIGLTFLESKPRALLGRTDEIFSHASNLTDDLVPIWMICIIAVLLAFGVPAAIIAALWLALDEDETTGHL